MTGNTIYSAVEDVEPVTNIINAFSTMEILPQPFASDFFRTSQANSCYVLVANSGSCETTL